MPSAAEEKFAQLLTSAGGEVAEYWEQVRFAKPPYANPPVRHPKTGKVRQWAFDFAWPRFRLAVEIEGLTAQGGRHQRIDGFRKDAEKYEAATLLGWRIYRIPAEWVFRRHRRVIWNIERMLADERFRPPA